MSHMICDFWHMVHVTWWYKPKFDAYLVLKYILYSLVQMIFRSLWIGFYLSSIWFRTVSVFLSLSQTSLLQPFIKYNRIYMKRTIISFKSLCSQGVSKQQLFEYIKRLQNVESSLIMWETRIKNISIKHRINNAILEILLSHRLWPLSIQQEF